MRCAKYRVPHRVIVPVEERSHAHHLCYRRHRRVFGFRRLLSSHPRGFGHGSAAPTRVHQINRMPVAARDFNPRSAPGAKPVPMCCSPVMRRRARPREAGPFCIVSEKSISEPERQSCLGVVATGEAEMTLHDSEIGREKLRLPASSWWIPSITLLVAALALVTALA